MRTYDVTLAITRDMPVWPGDTPPILELMDSIAAGDTANTSQIKMSVHTGTHVDAPHHFMNDGRTVEGLSMDILIGRAYVLHLPDVDLITAAVLEAAEIPPRTRRLLFKTRNSDYWAKGVKEFQTDFVASARMGPSTWWIAMSNWWGSIISLSRRIKPAHPPTASSWARGWWC